VTDTAPRGGSVKSVERCIDLLFILAERPMTLTEVSRQSGLSKSTALRLLGTLTYGGLVTKDPLNGTYRLGPGSLKLGQGFLNGSPGLASLAREPLQRLARQTGETVAVHVRLGRHRVCFDEVPSEQDVRYVADVGGTAPVHLGSAGRVLLAFMPAKEVHLLMGVSGSLALPVTGESLDKPQFLEQLEEVRRSGFAMSEGERIQGASAISVPVHGPGGLLVSLSILGPAARLTQQARIAALPLLQETARELAESLSPVS
jgi:DNA-binding IclR family transcriptional regulator